MYIFYYLFIYYALVTSHDFCFSRLDIVCMCVFVITVVVYKHMIGHNEVHFPVFLWGYSLMISVSYHLIMFISMEQTVLFHTYPNYCWLMESNNLSEVIFWNMTIFGITQKIQTYKKLYLRSQLLKHYLTITKITFVKWSSSVILGISNSFASPR